VVDPVSKAIGRNFDSKKIYNPGWQGRQSNHRNRDIDVHLTKDLNTLSESLPSNAPLNKPHSFAVLNNVSYFFAEDGKHGRELWRSDGTPAGTYMVKDINPGEASSNGDGIIAANNLLYFTAETPDLGQELWTSDGTNTGTHLVKDLFPGTFGSLPSQFVLINGTVFFATAYNANSQLWKTNGTPEGTILVKDIYDNGLGIGYNILELTGANNLAWFIAYTWSSGYQLFRSDGTDAGTYIVKQIGYGGDFTAPMQLTEYNHKLFFSVDDGTGRRLWTSDGTEAGTTYAPGFNDVFLRTDFMGIFENFPFRILSNVLYLSASKTQFTGTGELYKYDAASAVGITLVKELAEDPTGADYFVPVDVTIVNNKLIWKVISTIGGSHDELWTSDGTTAQTKLVKSFEPDVNAFVYFITNATNGKFYFVKRDNTYGNELWKSDGTAGGTLLVRDIYSGSRGSFPENLTFFNGRLLFRATTKSAGSELWSASGSGASLLKDINTTTTNSSFAGSNFFFKGIGRTKDGIVFNALTPDLGAELYGSDGTRDGTGLLKDLWPGEDWSYPNNFLYKNGVTYFINDNSTGTAILSTNGSSSSIKRVIPYINRDIYFVINYNVTDKGLVLYTLGNRQTGVQELWRSDGTDAGTFMLTNSLSYYFNNYLAVTGKLVFFIGGDFTNGYELWKSDGTVAGTKMVKDIFPGPDGSNPYNLFVYKNEVYFGAYDASFVTSLWKSDGSANGTIILKNIAPAFYYSYFNTQPQKYFCESKGILYISASDNGTYWDELWKTNGTPAGTVLVKDINSSFGSFPNHLTDVDGTLFFTAYDGINGNEIWKSNGTMQSTKMVKDITPTNMYVEYNNLCSAGGKLYFLNLSTYPSLLYSSDGTADHTNAVSDEGLNEISGLENLTGVGDKLFFAAYSYKYGVELYKGNAAGRSFSATTVSNSVIAPVETGFDAVLYPNPSRNSTSVMITGNTSGATVTITDISGKTLWSTNNTNQSQINLPVAGYAAGEYFISVTSGINRKVLKLVKK
jgi:ELWxxDGT repeat protein